MGKRSEVALRVERGWAWRRGVGGTDWKDVVDGRPCFDVVKREEMRVKVGVGGEVKWSGWANGLKTSLCRPIGAFVTI